MRVIAAGSLAWVLAAGGAAAPLTANAETTPVPAAVASLPSSSVVEATGAIAPSLVATPAPAMTTAAPRAKKLTVQQIIAKVGRAKGLSRSEVSALLWMAKRESNFHPTSKSSSGCYGLFQLSSGMAHGHPWKDAAWNTQRAIRYMKGRYGGVLKAKAFWSSHHWY